jgi:putative transcriptional regulator
MSIRHHPNDEILAAFAAGLLDLGQNVAIATHLVSCLQCRNFIRVMEHLGGSVLAGLSPAGMSSGALARVEARLSEPAPFSALPSAPAASVGDIPGLPDFVRRYQFERWKWVAPSVHWRRIVLPEVSETRVFLLKSGPGTKMLEHSHSETEMTCVLSGAFRHDGGHYQRGDFDLGDETVDHRPVVDAGEDCICLVAMRGELRLKGMIGRFIQPFVRF